MSNMENKLNEAGVFCHHRSLRRFVESDEFWSEQPYGNRLYFGKGGLDYVPRDILRTAINVLDKTDENERLRQQLATVTAHRNRLAGALDGLMRANGGGDKDCGHEFDCVCANDKANSVLAEAYQEWVASDEY